MPMGGSRDLAGSISGQMKGRSLGGGRNSGRISDDSGVFGGPASRRNSGREVIEDFGGMGRPIGPEPNRRPFHERVTKPVYGGAPSRKPGLLGQGQGSGTLAASPTAPTTISPPQRVTKPVLGGAQPGTLAKPAAPAPQPAMTPRPAPQPAMSTGSASLASPSPAPLPEGPDRLAEAMSGQLASPPQNMDRLAIDSFGGPGPQPGGLFSGAASGQLSSPMMQRPDPAQPLPNWKQTVYPWSGYSGAFQGGGNDPGRYYGDRISDWGSRWWER